MLKTQKQAPHTTRDYNQCRRPQAIIDRALSDRLAAHRDGVAARRD